MNSSSSGESDMEEDIENFSVPNYSLTPNICYWTSPTKSELICDWNIEDIKIVLKNPGIEIASQEFSSEFSTIFLKAQSNKQSLLISLNGTVKDPKHSILATNLSLSLYSSKKDSLPMKYEVADHLLYRKPTRWNKTNALMSLRLSIPLCNISDTNRITLDAILVSEAVQQFIEKSPALTSQDKVLQLECMFEEEQFWDAQIEIGDRNFKVHKIVLASASEVFHRMFESDMKEKTNGIVKVTDIDAEVMSNLLTYIYTGDTPNLQEEVSAKELMLVADKYDLQDLVLICVNYLKMKLSFSNVSELLLLADKLITGKSLRSACINFIRKYFTSVSQSESWKLLRETSKQLALEAIVSSPVQVCATKIHKENVSFRWIINDIKTLVQANSRVQGPRIETEVFPYPLYCYLALSKDNMTFELAGDQNSFKLSNTKHTDVWACDCSFTIMNMLTDQNLSTANCEDKKLLKFDKDKCDNYSIVKLYTCSPLYAKMMIDNEKIENFLQDQSLAVEVVVTIVNVNDYCQTSRESENSKSACSMHKNMKSMLKSSSFSDVVVKVQDKSFSVHKVILASASTFFLDELENSEDTVELFDVTSDIFSDILEYIYTGNTPNIKSNTTEILLAADRFLLGDLVSQCVYELQLKFTNKTVAATLAVADQLQTYGYQLRKACIPFIRQNCASVIRSDSWKTLSNSLALDILEQIRSQ